MKVRSSVKKICKHCRVVLKRHVVHIQCLVNPKHKQRQKFSTIVKLENNESTCTCSCSTNIDVNSYISKSFSTDMSYYINKAKEFKLNKEKYLV